MKQIQIQWRHHYIIVNPWGLLNMHACLRMRIYVCAHVQTHAHTLYLCLDVMSKRAFVCFCSVAAGIHVIQELCRTIPNKNKESF